MSTPITLSSTHTAVPLARFEPISESAEAVSKLLKPETHEHAKHGYDTITEMHEQLRAEKHALESAQKALTDAKEALKSARALAKLAVPTAINLGKLMDIGSIANFVARDESWLESIEGLAARFDSHGAGGKAIGRALTAQATQLQQAERIVNERTASFDRASQAFSATYRHLSNAIVFGRAVLTNLGVAVPAVSKIAGKKRKVADVPAPKPSPAVPASAVILAPAA